MSLLPATLRNQARLVSLSSGTRIAYRFNRGDLQSVREIWMDQAYRPPFPTNPKIVVDLGANIGMASVWFERQWHCEQIIAVEADESNAELVRKNFALNSIHGEVIGAAIGPSDGWASFTLSEASNAGHAAPEMECGGDAEDKADSSAVVKVPMVSMATVLKRLPDGCRIDLLKVDIEGGEGMLFEGDLTWLDRVEAIVIELHDEVTDTSRVARNIEGRGFKFIPTGSVFPGSISAFVRTNRTA